MKQESIDNANSASSLKEVETSSDWREKLLESLPYKDRELVNLPPKFDSHLYNLLPSQQVSKMQEDLKNNIFVFAAYLSPNRHLIVVYD